MSEHKVHMVLWPHIKVYDAKSVTYVMYFEKKLFVMNIAN